MNEVYVVEGRTDSGDDFLYLFAAAPTKEELISFLKKRMPDEFAAFDDEFGGLSFRTCEMVKLDEISPGS